MSRTRQAHHHRLGAGQVRSLVWDYPAGWQVPEHAHDAHQLVYATRGAMTVYAEGGTWLVPPLAAVWLPASTIHAIDMLGEVSMRTLYLARRLAPGLPAAPRVLAVSALLRELVLEAVVRERLDRRRARDRRLIAVLVDELVAAPPIPTRLPLPHDPRAARLAALLVADPTDHRTLPELAPAVGASVRTVQRAFEHDTGMTFVRWRQQLRLLHALRLIAGGAKVTSAAVDAGWDSPSAFVATFRRQLGTTPARYVAERGLVPPPADRVVDRGDPVWYPPGDRHGRS